MRFSFWPKMQWFTFGVFRSLRLFRSLSWSTCKLFWSLLRLTAFGRKTRAEFLLAVFKGNWFRSIWATVLDLKTVLWLKRRLINWSRLFRFLRKRPVWLWSNETMSIGFTLEPKILRRLDWTVNWRKLLTVGVSVIRSLVWTVATEKKVELFFQLVLNKEESFWGSTGKNSQRSSSVNRPSIVWSSVTMDQFWSQPVETKVCTYFTDNKENTLISFQSSRLLKMSTQLVSISLMTTSH